METGRDNQVSETPGHDRVDGAVIDKAASGELVSAPDVHGQAEDALRASEARYRQALAATEAALAKAQVLYHISSSQVAAESLETLLQRLVEVVAEALPADRVNLFAIDTDRRLVTGNYLAGKGGQERVVIDYDEVMEGLGGWVMAHREATLSPGGVPDPRESPRVDARRRAVGHGPMMVAPILYRDRASPPSRSRTLPSASSFGRPATNWRTESPSAPPSSGRARSDTAASPKRSPTTCSL